MRHPGRLAQLGEHQLDKLGVTGSSPVPPTSRKPRYSGVFSFKGLPFLTVLATAGEAWQEGMPHEDWVEPQLDYH
jgi:hypothetical protein